MSFFLTFLTSDISLNNLFLSLKLYRHGVKVWMDGPVSQILFIGPSFFSVQFRKKCLKNTFKFPVFSNLERVCSEFYLHELIKKIVSFQLVYNMS